MYPHYWLEFRPKKVALFVAVVVLILWLWFILPPETTQYIPGRFKRRFIPLSVYMVIAWTAGWFMLLFVRVQDMKLTAPFPYQDWNRVIACSLILASLAIAALLGSVALH